MEFKGTKWDMKGFIEVNRVLGEKTFLKSINIDNIIDFENNYINTSRIFNCHHTGASYTESVFVKETYEEIKQLIKEATELK